MGACISKSDATIPEQVTKKRFMRFTKVKAKMLAPHGEEREITPEVKAIQKLYGF
jgi:hypothetical protein